MAAWLKPLALALLAALLLHVLGLFGIGTQMQNSATLVQKNDPLFTRTIEAASAQAPEPLQPEPAKPVPTTERAPRTIALTAPKVTETLSQPAPEPTALSNTTSAVTLAAATPPESAEPAAAPTPSQSLSTVSTGAIDRLLATGQWPADTRVNYRLTGYFHGELFGTGQVQWTRQGESNERYQVRVTVDAGLYELRMTSQGRVSPQGLLPEFFEEYSKRVLASPRIRVLKLEDDALILEGERRILRPTAEPLAVQDSVSQFIDLGHRLSEGRAKLEEGQAIRVWLGRPGGLDEWTYDVGPAETVNLPRIGLIAVHQLKPRPLANPRGPITMSFWLAPSLQYLPAKIRIQLNPEAYVELIADEIQQR